MPVSVNVPVPIFVKAREPEPFCITPLKVVEESSFPTVRVFKPAELVEIVPAPAIDPIVSEAFTLYVAPEATVIALESLIDPDTLNEPAEIVVAPV